MNKTIIAAPFGIYVGLPGATCTRGTYTFEPRPGAVWGGLTRVKFTRDGVLNRMGMRNPGIESQDFAAHPNDIWSVAGTDYAGWIRILQTIPPDATVELNFSCPNIENKLSEVEIKAITHFSTLWFDTIVKLPADLTKACTLYSYAAAAGAHKFHACNTIKTHLGGLSGRRIQETSIPLVRLINKDGFTAIGGGGIYTPDDVKRYRDAGASHFSLGTIFFTPWKIPAVLKEINK